MRVYSAPRNLFQRLWNEPPPSLAVEFSSAGVAAARWTPGAGTAEQVAVAPLAEGALRPSPVRENLARPDDVRRALASALGQVSRRNGGNLAVFLPDVSARVSVVTFEQLPNKAEEAASLIRWRLKKTVPFEMEDATLAYFPQGQSMEGQEVVVAVTPHAVVRQYEMLLDSLEYEPGFVTLSSMAALGLLPESRADRASGTMLVRGAGSLLTIVVTSAGRLRIFRATELPAGEEARTLEEVFADAYSSAVYFQDSYGGKVEQIYLAGFGAQTAGLQELMSTELGLQAQPLAVPGIRGEEAGFLGFQGMIAEQARG